MSSFKSIQVFALVTLMLLSVTAMTGCTTTTSQSKKQRAGSRATGIKHVVLIWLKNDRDPESHAAVRKATEELRAIPTVRSLGVGTALPGRQGIVDSSFHLGFVMDFANQEALQAYLNHPEHMKRARYVLEPHSSRIIVYDIQY